MAKDKKKKKNKYGDTADEFMREYNESLELLKAKHEQLNGLIREANLFLQEIKDIRDNLKSKTEPTLDN